MSHLDDHENVKSDHDNVMCSSLAHAIRPGPATPGGGSGLFSLSAPGPVPVILHNAPCFAKAKHPLTPPPTYAYTARAWRPRPGSRLMRAPRPPGRKLA